MEHLRERGLFRAPGAVLSCSQPELLGRVGEEAHPPGAICPVLARLRAIPEGIDCANYLIVERHNFCLCLN